MTKLAWDNTGERLYETGVDHGVLYIPDVDGNYDNGVAWNGLTTVTESPSGAEVTALYADNMKYLNLRSAEEFGATLEAYTYPPEFQAFDGLATPSPGLAVGQQGRGIFGLSYRTTVGNDVQGSDYGYKLHLIWGASASPSEKAYGTINDSPEAITFSWELTTTPVFAGADLKPTALITIDSTRVDATILGDLEDMLYGTAGTQPHLPTPEEVIALFAGSAPTPVDMGTAANQPSYNASTHVVTLPTVTGVQWKVNGVNKAPGAQPALTVGQTAEVQATPTAGRIIQGNDNWTYDY